MDYDAKSREVKFKPSVLKLVVCFTTDRPLDIKNPELVQVLAFQFSDLRQLTQTLRVLVTPSGKYGVGEGRSERANTSFFKFSPLPE